MTDAELEALLAAAEPGPWHVHGEQDLPRGIVDLMVVGNDPRDAFVANVDGFDEARNVGNARLLAAAPTLARDLRELRGLARALVAGLPRCHSCAARGTHHGDDGDDYCDACAAEVDVEIGGVLWRQELPHAAPLRALLASLENGGDHG